MKRKELMTTGELAEILRALQLGYFADHLADSLAEAAKNQITPFDFLASLAEGEMNQRHDRGVQRRLREAKIPVPRSMDGFQWTHPAKINRALVEQLMRLDFLDSHSNVLIIGSCGVGKTHIATCLVQNACRRGVSALFAQAVEIVNCLEAAKATGGLPRALKKYVSPALLCVDELGYLPVDNSGCDLLFQVFSQRYERKSTIVTSNRACKDWAKIFNNDATVTTAILDRLVHHCEILHIEGVSYRLKDRVKE